MCKVVVNSTPLIILCGIGRLDILRMVYQEISIPTAVFREVTAKDDFACVQLKTSGEWIHVEEIKDHSEKKTYKATADNLVHRCFSYISEPMNWK